MPANGSGIETGI